MPLFESSTPYDEIIEKATNETNTSENWSLIMDICDRISRDGTKGAKNGLLSLKKRLNHRDPHVVMLALSVLDSCMGNCGLAFQREVCTREFMSEMKAKATSSVTKVSEKARLLIKKWSEDECKTEPSLSLVPTLYNELKRDGYKFETSDPPKKATKVPSDPNYVSTKEEEDAIAKAIQASLNDRDQHETVRSQTHKQNSCMYPSGVLSQPVATVSQRKVKALYDFEAAEENELTFKAGEIIHVIDDTDINWWKGSNHRGEGLFPASFATTDLNEKVIDLNATTEGKKKTVQFDENVEVKEVAPSDEAPRIDEDVLNNCLETLRDADPTGAQPDPPELAHLEDQCRSMGPLIDGELAEVDRQHNLLAGVDVKLRDALALYDTAMQEASAYFQAQLASMQTQQYSMMPQQSIQYQSQIAGQPQMYQQQPTYSMPTQNMPATTGQPQQNVDMSQTQQSMGPPTQQMVSTVQPQSYVNYGQ